MAKREKELESNLEFLEGQRAEEKKLRVKINQIENDLELQFKRLVIVCKTKGQPKPKRPECLPETPARNSTYVSPYRASPTTSLKSAGSKNNYTPPQRKPLHASSTKSDGSTKAKSRPSPGSKSQTGSLGNRLYSPNGQMREPPKVYAAHTSNTRVRREPAVSSNRSNNSDSSLKRQRAQEYANQVQQRSRERSAKSQEKKQAKPKPLINTYLPTQQEKPIMNKASMIA
jgi:hypothetical protein